MWMQAADRLYSQQPTKMPYLQVWHNASCGAHTRRQKNWNIWTNNPQSILYHSTASTPLLVQDTFQMINHCGCYGVNGYNEPLSHKILHARAHTHTKHIVYVRVCSTSTSHIWAQDKPHSIHKWGYQVCFTVNIWASTTIQVVVMGHNCYLIYDIAILWKMFHLDCMRCT